MIFIKNLLFKKCNNNNNTKIVILRISKGHEIPKTKELGVWAS